VCGIVGVLNLGAGETVTRAAVEQMCDAIRHRGPDDAGVFVADGVGLGMRRLSIIDVDAGRQPIANENETAWIVFNGEIYNHQQLRQTLEAAGHRFRTRSDTETILHLYEEHGTDCLRHLRGMFAFAIWDETKKLLFLARDRLGIKPLFWGTWQGRLHFASEIKALQARPGAPQEIDWNGFDAFFTYGYIPAPLTVYRHIAKLPPAHFAVVQDGRVSTRCYWDVEFSPKHGGGRQQIMAEFMDRFGSAVGMHLMSDVPLGAFLSGGLDSGLIVAMMGQASVDPPRTFSIGFGGDRGDFMDERPFAREIAARYNCEHHEIEVLPAIAEALDASAVAFDEPFADDSIIPTYHICKAARGNVTVVLTGLGGDEDFAGYERYLGFWFSRYYALVPKLLRDKVIAPLVGQLREEAGGHYRVNHLKRFVSGGSLDVARRYQSYLRILDPDQRRRLYSPDVARQVDFDYVESLGWEHFERLNDGDIMDRAIYQDLKMYLPDDILALSDRLGMHHSLELRVPFVDHEVVEFCARIPSSLKIRARQKKYLLREVARPFLPPSVLNHRKQGFSAPMAKWLRGDLRPLVEQRLTSASLARTGLFQAETVKTMVADHYQLKQLNDKALFSLLVFDKWLARNRIAP
jgi:asparagine synthase (glutamine-hydrolysing)